MMHFIFPILIFICFPCVVIGIGWKMPWLMWVGATPWVAFLVAVLITEFVCQIKEALGKEA